MERQVPRGVPRVFPFVRHGHYVCIVEIRPFLVAAFFAAFRRRRTCWIAFEPSAHVEVVELLRPKEAGKGLALDVAGIFGKTLGGSLRIEFVCFAVSGGEN